MLKPKPEIIELDLGQAYNFLDENFLISTQQDAYLFLAEKNGEFHTLKFQGATIRYGGPNDEGRGGHPLTKHGDFMYGFFEVKHSPWLEEQMVGNRNHPRHSDDLFTGHKHYIVCFKDVMFEADCAGYTLEKLSKQAVLTLVTQQLKDLGG